MAKKTSWNPFREGKKKSATPEETTKQSDPKNPAPTPPPKNPNLPTEKYQPGKPDIFGRYDIIHCLPSPQTDPRKQEHDAGQTLTNTAGGQIQSPGGTAPKTEGDKIIPLITATPKAPGKAA